MLGINRQDLVVLRQCPFGPATPQVNSRQLLPDAGVVRRFFSESFQVLLRLVQSIRVGLGKNDPQFGHQVFRVGLRFVTIPDDRLLALEHFFRAANRKVELAQLQQHVIFFNPIVEIFGLLFATDE